MAFKTRPDSPPKNWNQFIESVTHILENFGVRDKTPAEIITAARQAVVDTDPKIRENRAASLRRAVRRRPRQRKRVN